VNNFNSVPRSLVHPVGLHYGGMKGIWTWREMWTNGAGWDVY